MPYLPLIWSPPVSNQHSNFVYLTRQLACGAVAVLCLLSSASAQSPVFGNDPSTGREALIEKIRSRGETTVIVRLDLDNYVPEGRLANKASRKSQQARIGALQSRVLGQASSPHIQLKRQFRSIPYLALVVDEIGLDALARIPGVSLIQPELVGRTDVAESRLVVGADVANAAGCDGDGWAVAVLDTGVDLDHDAFSGKIAAEGCFSTNLPGSNQVSMCPGNATESTVAGSGNDCAPGAFPGVICPHGSLVAGVAAGNGGGIVGMAPAADVVAIRVLTNYTDGADCPGGAGGPFAAGCPLVNISDLMAGLEYVGQLADTMRIAAINISIDLTLLPGGPVASMSTCDGVAALSGIKDAIDYTNSLGIPAVASTGNQNKLNAINPPACLTNVISVGYTQDGSTYDATPTMVDSIGHDPNRSIYMDFWAPGEWITSAYPNNTTFTVRGTSVAAPHVAGALTALRSKGTASDPDYYVDLLRTTGVMVTDYNPYPVPLVTKPRIDVGAACSALTAISLDAKVLLEGAYAGSGVMSVPGGYTAAIPLSQPFDGVTFSGTPISYLGNQTLAALPAGVVDWVLVELRSSTSAASIVAQRAGLLKTDGSIVDEHGDPLGFVGVGANSYYVVVRHRNHAAIMSSAAIDFGTGTGVWDFTTAIGQAYTPSAAPPMKDLGGGHFGMFGGDANVDGIITAPDFNLWNSETSSGATGYQPADHDMDGNVTAPDFNLWNANTSAGAASRVPEP